MNGPFPSDLLKTIFAFADPPTLSELQKCNRTFWNVAQTTWKIRDSNFRERGQYSGGCTSGYQGDQLHFSTSTYTAAERVVRFHHASQLAEQMELQAYHHYFCEDSELPSCMTNATPSRKFPNLFRDAMTEPCPSLFFVRLSKRWSDNEENDSMDDLLLWEGFCPAYPNEYDRVQSVMVENLSLSKVFSSMKSQSPEMKKLADLFEAGERGDRREFIKSVIAQSKEMLDNLAITVVVQEPIFPFHTNLLVSTVGDPSQRIKFQTEHKSLYMSFVSQSIQTHQPTSAEHMALQLSASARDGSPQFQCLALIYDSGSKESDEFDDRAARAAGEFYNHFWTATEASQRRIQSRRYFSKRHRRRW